MTSSTEHKAAQEVLARLQHLLDPDYLARAIDGRVDQVVEEYLSGRPTVATRRQFHCVLAELTQVLYERGRRFPLRLSSSHALAEALAMIESGYPGLPADRYDAALLEATEAGGQGLERVLLWLAEGVKYLERRMYVIWAIVSTIDPADWHGKCAVVEALRQQYPHLFVGEIGALTTTELAGAWLALLSTVCALDDRDRAGLGWLGS